MKPIIYIDGQEGTTGLQIHDRLRGRNDITLLTIEESKRKDSAARQELIHAADIVFLCLPDDAAREAVILAEGSKARIIDASTAHRTAPNWVYGLPELMSGQRKSIAAATRVANPGCHATGFLTAVKPLTAADILPPDYPLVCFSMTGYSGGGKRMIADYEGGNAPSAPGLYGLTQEHKHIPEMMAVAALSRQPIFCPIVDDYYAGMAVTVALHSALLRGCPDAAAVRDTMAAYYKDAHFIHVSPQLGAGTLFADYGIGTNHLELTVAGTNDEITITARFDNLGKGASGAAVQNMNIMLGLAEWMGLD